MGGFIDLHCHWLHHIDDGAQSVADSASMLTALRAAGFATVCATPHMRPGLFDNTAGDLTRAFESTQEALKNAGFSDDTLPERLLSSEHFFDDIVYQRLIEGRALPYPGGRAALIEFPTRSFPAMITHRLFDLRRRGLRPVIAHPERYGPVWDDIEVLDPLLDGGAVLLLDVAALTGKYGRAPRRAAEELLDQGYYYAACSDAHAPHDVAEVAEGIDMLFNKAGREEAQFLLEGGPRAILAGTVDLESAEGPPEKTGLPSQTPRR